MTDAEIRQSRFDHYWMSQDIKHTVRSNTPSRCSWSFQKRRNRSVVWDHAGMRFVICRW
jgi:hypothetical protein